MLLNPALCALLLWRAAKGDRSANPDGLSFNEKFLILPMVLYHATRWMKSRLSSNLQECPNNFGALQNDSTGDQTEHAFKST
ncbi:MAG: hypothetical protein ISN28_12240 [Ectothiorhodospiraceae bacterium AqS1]|nr:hypothetical protein [Ectothiorhodospiraceae bacterium AqS1]